jgi:hypothetical protein
LTPRVPAQRHGFAGRGRLDHRVVAHADAHALAGLDHMVAEVAIAGQPDAAVDHREVTTEPPEPPCLAGSEFPGVPLELRIHHQSPVLRVVMIVTFACTIQ